MAIHKHLPIYRDAQRLVHQLTESTRKAPRDLRYTLVQQLVNESVELCCDIAPHRRSLRRSTVKRANRRIAERRGNEEELLATVNSYLGMARHGDTHRVRRRWTEASGLTPADDYAKVQR